VGDGGHDHAQEFATGAAQGLRQRVALIAKRGRRAQDALACLGVEAGRRLSAAEDA